MPNPTQLPTAEALPVPNPVPHPNGDFEVWFDQSEVAREFASKDSAHAWYDLREQLRALPPPAPTVELGNPAPGPASDDGSDPEFEDWYRTHGYLKFGTNKETAHRWFNLRKQATVGKGVALLDTMQKAMGTSA